MKILPLLLIVAILACSRKEAPGKEPDSVPPVAIDSAPPATSDLIHVTQPGAGAIVTSPLTITGEARGTWYFEASFPVILVDGAGDTLAVKPAQAQGEWMTENFVPFSVTLDFTAPATPTGTLILKKDNPSGLPEHDNELRLPVRFH